MDISFVVWGLGRSGGGGLRAIVEIVNRLSKKGNKVKILTLTDEQPWLSIQAEINRVELPYSLRLLDPLFKLRHKRRRTAEDVFHKSKFYSLLQADFAKIVAEAIPDCDISVATWYRTALPVFLSKKGIPFFFMQDFYEQIDNETHRKLFQETLTLPMHFITNSEYTRQLVLEQQPNATTKVVGAGVNTNVFYPRQKKLLEAGNCPTIMVIGRGEPYKRAEMAIQILNSLNGFMKIHANMVGWIPPKPEKNFEFTAFKYVTDVELARLYSSSDLFLFASETEGFALPPLEAMACGTPVAMTDCKGNREYAVNGYNCLLLQEESTERNAQQIAESIENKELLANLSRGGLQTASETTWDRVVERVTKAFSENTVY
jgi:glycosyltransferase involved in cell wall biosynthesis